MNKTKEEILNHLKDVLENSPNLRFGQSLAALGIFRYIISDGVIQGIKDIYYDTDEMILNRIESALEGFYGKD